MIMPGDAFFNQEVPRAPRHLWFVVCACGSASVVIANVSTNPGPDCEPCVIQPQEHPDISRVSYLRCDKSRLVQAAQLEALAKKQVISLASPASPTLLSKLRQGLLASQHTPMGVKEAVQRAKE